ncbi:MAG: hypothetical protein GQE15_37520 [Archangiaceae bacterium]|nr:hypothetical protein [Archangiaceae bacterium]
MISTLLLQVALAAPLSTEQMARAEPQTLTAELKRVDEALLKVQPVPAGQVFSKAGERGGIFLAVGMIPGLAVGLLLSSGGSIGTNDKLAVALGTPVLVAAGVGLVAFIGSLLEYVFVEGPERTSERERLTAYRLELQRRLSPSAAP